MIAKLFDATNPSTDPLLRAGWEAEKQMAFYLHRAFAADPAVVVLNNIRCRVHGAMAASDSDHFQIDHLVMHTGGFVIVESKSVSTEVKVEADGQWMRKWNGAYRGMASPIQQAHQQAEALRALLQAHAVELRGGPLLGFIPKGFKSAHMLTLVAVSDQGILNRRSPKLFPEAMKADQIAEHIKVVIAEHRAANALLNTNRPKPQPHHGWSISPAELQAVARFLAAQHVPAGGPAPATPAAPTNAPSRANPKARASVPTAPPAPQPGPSSAAVDFRLRKLDRLVCTKCGEEKSIEVVYRKDYCLLCHACEGYTSLGHACAFCGKHATIRKDGPTFYRDCAKDKGGCGKQVVFWVAK